MSRSPARQIAVVVATVGTITVNGMAPFFSPTGKGTGEISDQFQNFFTPAGYVFSIWGLIYSALLAYTVYQALPSQRENQTLARIDLPYILSCVSNAAWMVCWQREWFVATMFVMLGLLGSLLWLYIRLDASREEVSTKESWLIHWPFSVYLAWVNVATVANATILLQHLGWSGMGIPSWTWGAIVLCVALAIMLSVSIPRQDKAYILVLCWASIGIALKYSETTPVAAVAAVVAAICALAAVSFFLTGQRQNAPTPA